MFKDIFLLYDNVIIINEDIFKVDIVKVVDIYL